MAVALGLHAGLVTRDVHTPASWSALRTALATFALFGVCGLAPTRLLLPGALRRHEALWVLPVGGCVAALALGILGYAQVPFQAALGVTMGLGALVAVWALRRRPVRLRRPGGDAVRRAAWPTYLAVIVACLALAPLFRAGYATVIGNGSDAHLAAGTGELLRHVSPLGTDIALPVDKVPLVWRSKPPIYEVLGAVATLSGQSTPHTLSTLNVFLLTLAALGMFLVAREVLGLRLALALCAMAAVALDRMVLHTGMHPYYNQTWGWMTMPFALVLAWWTVTRRRWKGAVLLALFLALEAFSYPLAAPLPVLALVVFAWRERRARRARGEAVLTAGALAARLGGRRALWWIVPLVILLAIPAYGVAEKLASGVNVIVNPSASLGPWGGDLRAFIPIHEFFSVGFYSGSAIAVLALIVLAVLGLRRAPGTVRWGLGAILVLALVGTLDFRSRSHGWYFDFKLLAFVGPLVVLLAVAGMGRWRRAGPVLVAALLASATAGAMTEIRSTHDQLSPATQQLAGWAASLPPGASIRMDMTPGDQLWGGYLLAARPVCSQLPLLDTQYPRAPVSRRAGYVLIQRGMIEPVDAIGPPVRQNADYLLYRLRRDLPGPDRCSRRMIQSVTSVPL